MVKNIGFPKSERLGSDNNEKQALNKRFEFETSL